MMAFLMTRLATLRWHWQRRAHVRRADARWRRWEAVQERALYVRTPASRARHTRLIGAVMRAALLAPPIGGMAGGMGGDARGALLATGWAIRDMTRRAAHDETPDEGGAA